MKAYKRTALIPSRGVWGYNKTYASASGAIIKAFGEFPALDEWRDGFDLGFEHGHEPQPELLTYGCSKEFAKAFNLGHAVAVAIFDWPDSPDIYSKPEK